ncbi:MAG: hypothetical protein HWQ38_30630 [Nostoc sp. NMS7]|uniref:hypothetical protein n=1 Tax=unclassified Nostoc TaxID=2593658 RepID=UPI0025FF85DF|nr:hypothetical protein [Nostoc sp. NMS7]MBN3950588.1 hypothetical protein [Nostoc sp. NMS7]
MLVVFPIPNTSLGEDTPTTTLLRPFSTRRYANGKAQGNAPLSTSAHAQCPMPSAQCPMPNAQCPMPNAQCPMPNAQCPMPNDK